jgi:Cys-tRNA(Pro)/Cys-tRNA(Cys) deacylase
VVDEGIFEHDRLVIGSGVLGYAIELSGVDLRRALESVASGQFTKSA